MNNCEVFPVNPWRQSVSSKLALSIVIFTATTSLAIAADAPKPIAVAEVKQAAVDFQKDVLPIFARSCLSCHSKSEAQGGLILETPADIRKGGDNGLVIKDGKADESPLLRLAAHRTDPIMPPADNDVNAAPLKPLELGLLKLWIDQGAKESVGGGDSKIDWRPIPASVRPVLATALSPDGKIAAIGRANEVILIDLAGKKEIGRCADPSIAASADPNIATGAHRDLVRSVAFSSTGDRIASGDFRTIKIWKRTADLWSLERTIGGLNSKGLADRVLGLSFSPDGALLASSGGVPSRTGEIKLWSMADGKLVRDFPEVHSDTVFDVAFSPDGKKLATASADKVVRILEVASGKPAKKFEGHVDYVLCVAWSKDGKLLASGGADHVVKFWNTETGQQQKEAKVARHQITGVQFVGATSQVIAISGDQSIRLIEPEEGKAIRSFNGPEPSFAQSLSVAGDGQSFVVGGANGTLRQWNTADGKHLFLYPIPPTKK